MGDGNIALKQHGHRRIKMVYTHGLDTDQIIKPMVRTLWLTDRAICVRMAFASALHIPGIHNSTLYSKYMFFKSLN